MKHYLSVLTARIGKIFHFEWRLRWPATAGPWPLYLLLALAAGLYAAPRIPPLQTLLAQISLPHIEHAAPRVCAPFGGRESRELGDHSIIELDSGACVAIEMSAKARLVKLESGEAIVHVARDPNRPFTVQTGPLAITALGTALDVYRKGFSTRVTVIEGSVQVASRDTTPPRSSTKPLTMLQQLDVPDDTAQPMVRRDITSGDLERMTAWLSGHIQLERQTLKEALEEFGRYQHFQVYFEDKRLEEIRFSGTFKTVNVDSFLLFMKLNCVHGEYDKDAQLITVTYETGKRSGAGCR